MKRRHFSFFVLGSTLIGATSVAKASGAVAAAGAEVRRRLAGVEAARVNALIYTPLDVPQPIAPRTAASKAVELRHFFSYASPACASTEQAIVQWKERWQGLNVLRSPVVLHDNEYALTKLCLAVESLPTPLRDGMHGIVLDAIHSKGTLAREASLDEVLAFVDTAFAEHGGHLKMVLGAAHGSLDRIKNEMRLNQVTSAPQFVVHGKYLVSPGDIAKREYHTVASNLYERVFSMLDRVIAHEAKLLHLKAQQQG